MSEFVTVALVTDLPGQGGLDVSVNGRRITIFASEDGVFALDASCPHRGAPLSVGWTEKGSVFCPMHGWEFVLATGLCKTNPEKSIQAYEVRVVDGAVQIACPLPPSCAKHSCSSGPSPETR